MMKKEPRGVNPNPSPLDGFRLNREGDDGQYVHVEFKDFLKDWRQGKEIIKNISNLLHMEPRDFPDGL